MKSYLTQLEPFFLKLAKEIEQVPDSNGVLKRSAGIRLPEVARSIRYFIFKALPQLLEGRDISISISLDKNHYSSSNIYNVENFRYNTHVDRAFNKLVDAGYIYVSNKGWMDRASGRSDNTKYRLTSKCKDWLLARLDEVGFSGDLYTLITDPELLPKRSVLRVQKTVRSDLADGLLHKERIAVDSTPVSLNIVSDVERINRLLAKTWVDLDLTKEQKIQLEKRLIEHKRKEKSQFIRYNDRQLYRVFHDTNFITGGRYYGGWWETIPSEFRRHLVIDGKATVEIDFSGLHPSILYAKEGLEMPRDPYAQILGERYRDTSKKLFNALINAKHDLKGPPRNVRIRYPDQPLSWVEIKQRICELHKPICHNFCTGAGLTLMHEDSELATDVMLHFANMGVPCLPVHDSFIIHHAYEDELYEKMEELFLKKYKIPVKLKKEMPVFYREDLEVSEGFSVDEILSASAMPQEQRLMMFRQMSC